MKNVKKSLREWDNQYELRMVEFFSNCDNKFTHDQYTQIFRLAVTICEDNDSNKFDTDH